MRYIETFVCVIVRMIVIKFSFIVSSIMLSSKVHQFMKHAYKCENYIVSNDKIHTFWAEFDFDFDSDQCHIFSVEILSKSNENEWVWTIWWSRNAYRIFKCSKSCELGFVLKYLNTFSHALTHAYTYSQIDTWQTKNILL